jgi:DNA-binding transcriptional ArsR family regulator
MLKSHDVLLALGLMIAKNEKSKKTQQSLANAALLSQAEVSNALKRLENCHLIDARKRELIHENLIEFVAYGIRYAFAVSPGALMMGVPTGTSSPVLKEHMLTSDEFKLVWPHPLGKIYGQAIEPLHEKVPEVCDHSPEIYKLLCLVDAIRLGKSRSLQIGRDLFAKEVRSYL